MDNGDPTAIRIVLPGVPRAWQRSGERVIVPKSGAKPFVHHFTPAQTAREQDGLRFIAQAAMRGRPPLDCAVDFRMTAFMPIPPSWSKRKQENALAGLIWPTPKPDLDNIAKMKDALKAIVWRDDALVCAEYFLKVYSDRPRVVIEVRPLGVVPQSLLSRPVLATTVVSPLIGVG
jgi:Holliday junction resolvase RusA-like endonuclease